MFNQKKTTADRKSFDILIGADSEVKGDLKSKGAIRIDGTVEGNVTSESKVIISSEASVTGNVVGSEVDLSGRLIGDISSPGHLKVHPSGTLKGDVDVSSFTIDEGAVFEGACHIEARNTTEQDTPTDRWSDKKGQSVEMDPEDIA